MPVGKPWFIATFSYGSSHLFDLFLKLANKNLEFGESVSSSNSVKFTHVIGRPCSKKNTRPDLVKL